MSLVSRLDRRFYPDIYATGWDDWLLRDRVLEHLKPEHSLLDLGAGAGIVEAMNFVGLCAKVVGLDPEASVLSNPHLDEAKVGYADSLPFAESSFDIVVCDNVLEHLDDPESAFREIRCVLRPGGLFLSKTPNSWHYVPLIARLTPTRFHRFYNRLRGRHERDTFPTRYRANRPKRIRELAAQAGLRVRSIELLEGRPEYLRLSALTYLPGIAYERLVSRFGALSAFRTIMIVVLEKP